MTKLAFSESASLISSLAQNEIQLGVESIGVFQKDSLDQVLGEFEPDMISVHQQLEGIESGHIHLVMPEITAQNFLKKLLSEPDRFKVMTELEEESLTEIANIIINNCLSHYVQIMREAFSSQMPSLSYIQYREINEMLGGTSNFDNIYCVKMDFEIMPTHFPGFLLLPDHLFQIQRTNPGRHIVTKSRE